MITLSRKCRYGLRALYLLTSEYKSGPISSARIAQSEKLPQKFLEAIMVQMRNSGIVESLQGKNGGYYLSSAPDEITLGAVVRALDGPLETLPCVNGMIPHACLDCPDVSTCKTRSLMLEVRNAIAEVLDHTTLADLCKDQPARPEMLTYEI